MRKIAAILAGLLISKITRSFKLGGGSAAPGLYALKIDPELVIKLAKQIPQHIIITGTNGKTTTARLLAHFCKSQGLKILRNATGSNLERGVASALLSCSRLPSGKLKEVNLAIWELDEAAFNSVAPKLNPQVIVFLNVFRDQLDRYGEVDTVVKKWCQTLSFIDPLTKIYINGDDQNLLQLKKCFSGKVETFGVQDYKIEGEKVIYHLEKENLDFEAINIHIQNLNQTRFSIKTDQKLQKIILPLPGIYNVYNFLAAYTCGQDLGLKKDLMVTSLGQFSPAFGRVEKLSLRENKEGYIFLIKNPAGATQVFQTLQPQFKPQDRLFLALNDNLADGTDVSWIWDTQFEELRPGVHQLQTVCSGIRVEDLALRLKYAGFDPQYITIENDLKQALEQAQRGLKGRLFILPTYTAMLELQKILAKLGLKNRYWEES